jgi:hypothetical protein
LPVAALLTVPEITPASAAANAAGGISASRARQHHTRQRPHGIKAEGVNSFMG